MKCPFCLNDILAGYTSCPLCGTVIMAPPAVPAPRPVPQEAFRPAPQYAPQPAQQYAPQPAPQYAPAPAPQPAPVPAPQYAPAPAPQPAPVPAAQPAPTTAAPAAEETWTCPVCFSGNRMDYMYCMICGGQRPAPGQAQPVMPGGGEQHITLAPMTEPKPEEAAPAETAPAWICAKCGKENDAEYAFCLYCGTPKQAVPAEPEETAEPETPAKAEISAEPEISDEPETLAEAEIPAEPEIPDEPETPAEPGTPDEPEPSSEPEVPAEAETAAEPEEPAAGDTGTWTCSACGQENDASFVFCCGCGRPRGAEEPDRSGQDATAEQPTLPEDPDAPSDERPV
ncbi:MAG: hypothetical protein IKS31_12830 [Clostridia bacterium]|nr:hypothetical protein [Clostridia bacterium]